MFAQVQQIHLFPEAATAQAQQVDALFFFILGITVFFTTLVAVLVLTFAIKYRRRSDAERPPRIEGSLRLEIFWSAVPLVLGLVIFVWGARLYFSWAKAPEDRLEIYCVGKQWMWKFQHPGGQREINDLHVPVGRPVHLTMISQDVIHSFFVPEFRVHQDVLPGRYTTVWFEANKTGTYHLFCSQYCGTYHSQMIGRIIVMEQDAYQAWLARGVDGSPATEGRKLFSKLQCITCHSADAGAGARAGAAVRQGGGPAGRPPRPRRRGLFTAVDPVPRQGHCGGLSEYHALVRGHRGRGGDPPVDRVHQVPGAGADAAARRAR